MRKDLLYHITAGFLIAALTAVFLPVYFGLVTATAAGIGKELYDKYFKETFFDKTDLFATIWGGCIGTWIIWTIKEMIQWNSIA